MTPEHSLTTHAALDAEYEILHELGRGGTALVYLARERATGDEVAIKVIRSRYIEDDEAQARFAREARLVAQLHHPNIVPVRAVLDLGTAGLAIVMNHVSGRTLKHRIKEQGPLSIEEAEQILRDIGGALSAAHANGIVHRDVKPENIFVGVSGRALLADFGLARSMTPDSALTMAGVALGTPAYMAPEQIDGNDLDARVDVYSLGLVAWEMLIGRRAWNGEGLYAILYHQKHELPPDVRELRDDVPDRLAEVIARAIEKTRDARWDSVREMLDALDESTPLTLAPRRVGGGGETMRFVRPPIPTSDPSPSYALPVDAPSPAFAMDVPDGDSPELEVPRRRIPLARTATVVAMLSVAAIATALVRNRSALAPAAPAKGMIQPTLQGDVAKPVTIPALPDTHAVRLQGSSKPVASPAPITQKLAAPPDSASPPERPVSIPALAARPNVTVNAAAATEKISTASPSTASVWGGPAPLTLKANIAAGGGHSCTVNAVGQARCWGKNDHGQLGDVTGSAVTAPVVLNVPTQFVAITAGSSHTCAIGRDGAAWCWGANDRGQSGDRSLSQKLAPVRVADAHVFWAIDAGDMHTCALDAYGVPWCWGSNAHGQLGDPATTQSAVPVTAGRSANRFLSIAAGLNFTCALGANGRASCWGENGSGQLGDGSTFDRGLPVTVAAGPFTSITAGGSHACGLSPEGEAFCWGRNTFGQLGDAANFDRSTPVRVRGSVRFTSITAGANHTCGVATDGTGYCWGQNTYGQLGTGSAADVSQPSIVADGYAFASIRAFGAHTCGLTVRGEAYCWGENQDNQVGDGSKTHRSRPTWVSGARDR